MKVAAAGSVMPEPASTRFRRPPPRVITFARWPISSSVASPQLSRETSRSASEDVPSRKHAWQKATIDEACSVWLPPSMSFVKTPFVCASCRPRSAISSGEIMLSRRSSEVISGTSSPTARSEVCRWPPMSARKLMALLPVATDALCNPFEKALPIFAPSLNTALQRSGQRQGDAASGGSAHRPLHRTRVTSDTSTFSFFARITSGADETRLTTGSSPVLTSRLTLPTSSRTTLGSRSNSLTT